MMRTFDKKNLGKDPPHFLILLRKTSADGYVWTMRSTLFAAEAVIFFFEVSRT